MLERSEDTELNLTSFAYKETLLLVKFIVLSWNFWQTPGTLKFSFSTLDNKLEDLLLSHSRKTWYACGMQKIYRMFSFHIITVICWSCEFWNFHIILYLERILGVIFLLHSISLNPRLVCGRCCLWHV